jgi:hypothetical protein
MKSRLAAGLLLGCLAAAAGCSSIFSSSATSPATTSASPAPAGRPRTSRSPLPAARYPFPLTASCPGLAQPVPARRGRGSYSGSGWFEFGDARRRVHHPQPAPDAFTFYKDNSTLTTSGQKSAGAGSDAGRMITAPTRLRTVVSHSGTTYIVIVLTSSPSPSPSAT